MNDVEKLIKSIKEAYQKVMEDNNLGFDASFSFTNVCIRDLYNILSVFFPHAALVIKNNYGVIVIDETFYDTNGKIDPQEFFKEKNFVNNLDGELPLFMKEQIIDYLTHQKVYKKLM